MGDLTKHFSLSEFVCECGCGKDDIDLELVDKLEAARVSLGSAVVINSGCRCFERNQAVGGEKASRHLYGKGADLRCVSAGHRYRLIRSLMEARMNRVKVYEAHIHVDLGNPGRQFLFLA